MSNCCKVIASSVLTWAFIVTTLNAQVVPVSGYVAPWIEMKPISIISNNVPTVASINVTIDKMTNIKDFIVGLNSRANITSNSVVSVNGFKVTLAQINNLNETLSGINNLVYNTELLVSIISGLNGQSSSVTNNSLVFNSLSSQSQSLVLLAESIGKIGSNVDKTVLFSYIVNTLNGSSTLVSSDKLVFNALSSQSQSLVLLAESIKAINGNVNKTELFTLVINSLNGSTSLISSDKLVFNALNAQSQALVLLAESIGGLNGNINKTELFSQIISSLNGSTILISSDKLIFNTLNAQSQAMILLAESVSKLDNNIDKTKLFASIISCLNGSSSLISSDKLTFNALNAQSQSLILLAESIGKLNSNVNKSSLYTELITALNNSSYNTTNILQHYNGITTLLQNNTLLSSVIVPLLKTQSSKIVADILIQIDKIQSQYSLTVLEVDRLAGIVSSAMSINTDKIIINKLSANTTKSLNKQPIIMSLNGYVVFVAYNYVFSWREDKVILFPEIAERQAHSDSYFGSLERYIKDACEENNFEEAKKLSQRYVNEWNQYNRVPHNSRRR